MKNWYRNLSELKKMVVIASLIGLLLIILSTFGLFFNQPGWLIGVTLGSIIEIINVILLFKGGSIILKESKPGLFLLFYALRMILFVGVILGLVLLQYKANIEVFKYSFFGALIGYTPTQIVVIIVTLTHKKVAKNG